MPSVAMPGFLLPHVFVIVGVLMGVVLVLRVLMERRPTGSTFAWLLAIVLIPYVGIPLYLVFGRRKLSARARAKRNLYSPSWTAISTGDPVTRVLRALGAPAPTIENSSELLLDGEAAFFAVVSAIRAARRSIHVSTLILSNDDVGRAVTDALVARAREGIEVRVLIDALFEFRSGRGQISALRQAGARVSWFMPVWPPFRGRANLRLHRKAILVDDTVAIVGGMNLAREYMGPTPIAGRWRDLSTRIVGPAVRDVSTVFRADYRFASGESLPEPRPEPAPPAGAARVQVVASGPDVESDLIYDAFLCGVFAARERLWIATPYFVPDDGLAHAVVLAARRGVDVRVLVPARSNHLTADLAGGSRLRELADSGARIYLYPTMMHAKVFIVDGGLGVLGSANMDMRSLFLDYELALFYSSSEEVTALARWFESTLAGCSSLGAPGRWRRFAEALARLLAPLE